MIEGLRYVSLEIVVALSDDPFVRLTALAYLSSPETRRPPSVALRSGHEH